MVVADGWVYNDFAIGLGGAKFIGYGFIFDGMSEFCCKDLLLILCCIVGMEYIVSVVQAHYKTM